MTTAIPLSVFSQIVQTNSSPETTAALLNEAEASHSKLRKHLNSKRVYPFWKTCQVCLNPFPCLTKEQATRNKMCSKACLVARIKEVRATETREVTHLAEVKCAVCGKAILRRKDRLAGMSVCSYQCGGVLRGQEWGKHAYKAAAAMTPAGRIARKQKISGANNPAWKGGVTYFRKHGNYGAVKYVRCPLEYLGMARKDSYVMEHRLIVAQAMGRLLSRLEVVHHKDHNPKNNALNNLQLFANNSDHKKHEARGLPVPIWSL